eukprot:Em0002g245a
MTPEILDFEFMGLQVSLSSSPVTPTVKETGKSQKEADERYLTVEPLSTAVVFSMSPVLARLTSNTLLLKKDPPEQRVSTGLADNPVRAISFSLAGVADKRRMTKPAVAIFVLNLSEELSHQPTIEYYGADGKPIGAQNPSQIKAKRSKHYWMQASFRIVYNGEELEEVIICCERENSSGTWTDVLLRSSHDGILSLVECQGCAKRLHIEGDAFSAALHHLVHNNVFLHYPEVLPQTVFCDPQVVLTKVSEIVEYHHKLLYRPARGVAAKEDLVKFRDHGLLSVELLNTFSKHYAEGSVHCTRSVKVIGCIPSGLFCCLVAQLLSPSNHSPWNVCMDAGKPLCLYRNCITFDTTEIVTLVDMFSYIVLHVDEMSSEVCREIRGCVSQWHQDSMWNTQVPSYSCVERRSGSVAFEDTREEILCEGKLMWFGESGVMKQDPSAAGTVPVTLDSEPSLQHLMEKVAAVIPHKYEMVGLQLGLTLAQLQAIRPQHQSLGDYHRAFSEIFNEWRRQGSPPYTWGTLTGVLRSASVDEVLLSEQLTSWLTQQ